MKDSDSFKIPIEKLQSKQALTWVGLIVESRKRRIFFGGCYRA
jgi:hypothetical protein